MASLKITMTGLATLARNLLQHLGIKPGERIDIDKMPDGELRVRAARPAGTIENFIGRHAGKVKKPMTIEEMNELAVAGPTDKRQSATGGGCRVANRIE